MRDRCFSGSRAPLVAEMTVPAVAHRRGRFRRRDDVEAGRFSVADLEQPGLDGGVASRAPGFEQAGHRAMRTGSWAVFAISHGPPWAGKSPWA